MVRWGRGRGDLDSNLTEGMARPTEPVDRDRVLTADDIKTMWAALIEADMRESTRRILRLCLVRGQRIGEIAGMVRSELDLIRDLWTIPGTRTKNGRDHVVPLCENGNPNHRRSDRRRDSAVGAEGQGDSAFRFSSTRSRCSRHWRICPKGSEARRDRQAWGSDDHGH